MNNLLNEDKGEGVKEPKILRTSYKYRPSQYDDMLAKVGEERGKPEESTLARCIPLF